MQKLHQNILFLAEVMNFFKSGSQYNYYTQGVARLKKSITSARNNIFKCVFCILLYSLRKPYRLEVSISVAMFLL